MMRHTLNLFICIKLLPRKKSKQKKASIDKNSLKRFGRGSRKNNKQTPPSGGVSQFKGKFCEDWLSALPTISLKGVP